MYDPINLVGRQSFLGEPHYLFLFGKNPDERVKKMNQLFIGSSIEDVRRLIRAENISYIAIYKDGKKVKNQDLYENNYKKVYEDRDVSLLMSAMSTSPER